MNSEHGRAAGDDAGAEAELNDAVENVPNDALDGAAADAVAAASASGDSESGDAVSDGDEPADTAESEIEGLRAQLAQREDALLRVQAELENQRRRAQRDVENAHKFGIEKFVAELLPVKDSMELGLASGTDSDVAALREGLELTSKMLTAALEKLGVTQVDPQGEAFNPELHQAMSMQEGADIGPGKVVTVFQKGYLLNERLVRPAMVIVSK